MTINFLNRKVIADIANKLHHEKETARLDWLSDPKNVFRYSLAADGQCNIGWRGTDGAFPSLRAAIDFYMEKQPTTEK